MRQNARVRTKQYFCSTKMYHTHGKENYIYFSIFRFFLQLLNTCLLFSSLLCLFFSSANEEVKARRGDYMDVCETKVTWREKKHISSQNKVSGQCPVNLKGFLRYFTRDSHGSFRSRTDLVSRLDILLTSRFLYLHSILFPVNC